LIGARQQRGSSATGEGVRSRCMWLLTNEMLYHPRTHRHLIRLKSLSSRRGNSRNLRACIMLFAELLNRSGSTEGSGCRPPRICKTTSQWDRLQASGNQRALLSQGRSQIKHRTCIMSIVKLPIRSGSAEKVGLLGTRGIEAFYARNSHTLTTRISSSDACIMRLPLRSY
jgi:hypothetical protein